MEAFFRKEYKNYISVLAMSAFFWIFAHGYRFANNLHTSDSLVSVFQDDIYWQRSLGRFMQPLTMMVRGVICAPWLIMGITIVFFSLAVFFLCTILKIDNKIITFILCGVLICNVTWTASVASFLPWVDIYAVALFLAVLGVWFYQKDQLKSYIWGSICFICCMGYYQAYIDVALVVIGILLISELAMGEIELKAFWKKLLKNVGAMAASGAGYFVVYQLVCKVHHVTVSSTYNGLAEVGVYEGYSAGGLIAGAYKQVFSHLWNADRFVSTILLGHQVSEMWSILLKLCMIASLVIVLGGIIWLNIQNRTSLAQRIVQVCGLLVLPLAINFVYIMSKGMEHELMILSFFFVYVFAIFIVDRCIGSLEKPNRILWICMIPFVLLIWNNIVYSNQIYFKLDMEDRAALSTATRLVSDIEDVDGYEPGVTPVVFIGGLESASKQVVYLQNLEVYGNFNTPFTYDTFSLGTYIDYYLDVDMNVQDVAAEDGIVEKLAVYPRKDAMKMIDDVLYVRLSE